MEQSLDRHLRFIVKYKTLINETIAIIKQFLPSFDWYKNTPNHLQPDWNQDPHDYSANVHKHFEPLFEQQRKKESAKFQWNNFVKNLPKKFKIKPRQAKYPRPSKHKKDLQTVQKPEKASSSPTQFSDTHLMLYQDYNNGDLTNLLDPNKQFKWCWTITKHGVSKQKLPINTTIYQREHLYRLSLQKHFPHIPF